MDIRKGLVVSRTNLIDSKKETGFPVKAASLIVFVTLALWGGALFYHSYVQKKMAILEQQLASVKTNRDYQKIATVADTQSRLNSINSCLAERIDWSNFFKKLEENTIPEVTFTDLAAKNADQVGNGVIAGGGGTQNSDYKVSIKGTTIGLDNLAKQIEVFKDKKDAKAVALFENVEIEKIDIKKTDSGQVDSGHALDFTLNASINPAILNNNSNNNSTVNNP